MLHFLKRQLFVVMLAVSLSLHAVAAWIGQADVRPPTVIAPRPGTASISLRSSVAAGPKPSAGGKGKASRPSPDSLAALPPLLPSTIPDLPVTKPARPLPLGLAEKIVKGPRVAAAAALPALKPETRLKVPDLAELPHPEPLAAVVPQDGPKGARAPGPVVSVKPETRPRQASAAGPALKAETALQGLPDLPDLPPQESMTATASPGGARPTPVPGGKAITGPTFHSQPASGKEDRGKESGPRLEAVTVISDKVSGSARGSLGSQGSKVDNLPQGLDSNPSPPYPASELAAGVEGTVVLWVKIDAAGKVTHVHVDQTSGVEAFDQSALTTVRDWRFNPARRGDEPVPYEVRLPVEFFITARRR